MDKDLLPRMKRRKRRQLWKRIVGTLGVLVVFCTVYALVLPAITLSDQPVCGLDAHTHTEDCYRPNWSAMNVPCPPPSVKKAYIFCTAIRICAMTIGET